MAVTMVRTAQLLPLVVPFVPNCPAFVAEQMLRLAAVDFAERSRAWRHIADFDMDEDGATPVLTGLVEGEPVGLVFVVDGAAYQETGAIRRDDVQLVPPSAAVIHEIEYAEWNGDKLDRVQFSTISKAAEGKPRYITQTAPNGLTLYPYRAGRLTVSMFLKPSTGVEYGSNAADPMFDSFNMIPDFFATLHGQTIALGALYRIHSIEDEPWSNEKRAMIYKAEFEEKLNASFRATLRGQQRAPVRTKYRDF